MNTENQIAHAANATIATHSRRADFSGATLVASGRAGSVDDFIVDELLGLPFQFHTIYGTLRDAAGDLFTLTRRITRGDGGPMRLIFQTTQGGLPHLKLHGAGKTTARARGCQRAIIDGRLQITSAENTSDNADQPFRLERGLADLAWEEKGLLSIRGRAVGPELKWYLPRPGRRFLYISQSYYVEGSILGRAVRGFICFDDTYKPDETVDGASRHPWNPLIDDGLGIAIFNWGNHYADGSCEAGLFAIGHGLFGVGLYANDHANDHVDDAGQVIASPDIEGEIILGPDGRVPARIEFRLAGTSWEFRPDARGTMPNLASPAQELDGRMRRVGDAREPDVWFSWGQTFPAHGTRRRA